MTFDQFCEAHGLIVGTLDAGRWKRVATTDKPKGRNGAYKWLGNVGWVQNWATMTEPSMWRDEADSPIARQEVRRVARQAARETTQAHAQAAQKAAGILRQCNTRSHAYLAAKGFPDEVGNVWSTDNAELLVIPMRIAGALVGCQLIGEDGGKKFLTGQRTGGAEFVFDNGGPNFLCEGYATALSVRHALRNLKRRYTLHVCFSAGNMVKVAATLPSGFVLADNDESGTGERVAREIGWPYWMSDAVGEDANDFHQRKGLFALAQGLAALLSSTSAAQSSQARG